MRQSEIFELIKLKFPNVIQDELTKAVTAPKKDFLEIAGFLKSEELAFNDLHCLTAIDRKENIELVYIFYSMKIRLQIILKAHLFVDSPEIESLTNFYRSADWFEREVYDLFGVRFLNHPNLCRILNPSGWKGFPLRKDYSHPDFIKKERY